MNDADDTYPVDWHGEAWDEVILNNPCIARGGGPGDWFMYRPGRLLVDAEAARDGQGRRRCSTTHDVVAGALARRPTSRRAWA